MNAGIKRALSHYSHHWSQRQYHWNCDQWCDWWSGILEFRASYPQEVLYFGISFQIWFYHGHEYHINSLFSRLIAFQVIKWHILCFPAWWALWLPCWMQQCFNVLIDVYHVFLLLFHCCVQLEMKFTTTIIIFFHSISSPQWYLHNQYHHHYLHTYCYLHIILW